MGLNEIKDNDIVGWNAPCWIRLFIISSPDDPESGAQKLGYFLKEHEHDV